MERYSRQILLPEIGGIGQKKLAKCSVGLVGANSMGLPFFLFGVGAGIGRWGVIDTSKSRAKEMDQQAKLRNPEINVKLFSPQKLKENVASWVNQWSIVVDLSNDSTIQLQLSSACQLTGIPFFSACCHGSTGLLFQAPCPFCLLTAPPQPTLSKKKSDLATMVPGLIGTVLAQKIVKFLLEPGVRLSPGLTSFCAEDSTFTNLTPYMNKSCPTCNIVNN
ncbi:MAG: ThiF family adenylyltransferase [Magnetococcales bacterium]|nr:ThiF family adenylyltransferase [Magnetococcales bacterium]